MSSEPGGGREPRGLGLATGGFGAGAIFFVAALFALLSASYVAFAAA